MIKKKYSISVNVSDGGSRMSRSYQTRLINKFEKMLMEYEEEFGDIRLKVVRFIKG